MHKNVGNLSRSRWVTKASNLKPEKKARNSRAFFCQPEIRDFRFQAYFKSLIRIRLSCGDLIAVMTTTRIVMNPPNIVAGINPSSEAIVPA